jgi:hypothetical protein
MQIYPLGKDISSTASFEWLLIKFNVKSAEMLTMKMDLVLKLSEDDNFPKTFYADDFLQI